MCSVVYFPRNTASRKKLFFSSSPCATSLDHPASSATHRSAATPHIEIIRSSAGLNDEVIDVTEDFNEICANVLNLQPGGSLTEAHSLAGVFSEESTLQGP